MDKYYKLSRGIICILAFMISVIMLHSETMGVILNGAMLVTVVAFVAGLVATRFSKRMIAMGDRIEKNYLRVFFYVVGIPGGIILSLGLTILFYILYDRLIFVEVSWLGGLIMFVLVGIVLIMLVVPYIQVLIVLLLRVIDRKKVNKV